MEMQVLELLLGVIDNIIVFFFANSLLSRRSEKAYSLFFATYKRAFASGKAKRNGITEIMPFQKNWFRLPYDAPSNPVGIFYILSIFMRFVLPEVPLVMPPVVTIVSPFLRLNVSRAFCFAA